MGKKKQQPMSKGEQVSVDAALIGGTVIVGLAIGFVFPVLTVLGALGLILVVNARRK